jgi:hypothetical protein
MANPKITVKQSFNQKIIQTLPILQQVGKLLDKQKT